MKNIYNSIEEIRLIVTRIINNIIWNKVRKPEYWEDKEGKIWVTLVIPLVKATCYIQLMVSEKDKQELEKLDNWKITENFIENRLINYGKNGYFNDRCPECEQTTLTSSLIVNNYSREAIVCNLCGWTNSMETYSKYLGDKKHSFLEFPEWLNKHNRLI